MRSNKSVYNGKEIYYDKTHKAWRYLDTKEKVGVGRNKPCPCGSTKKLKLCCLHVHELAASKVRANEKRIQIILGKIFKERKFKKANIEWKYDEKTEKTTYWMNKIKVLIIDYTGIPMNLESLENVQTVADVVVDDIPYEVPLAAVGYPFVQPSVERT